MAIWVMALSALLIVSLGDFSANGEDIQEIAEELVREVDTKRDDSVDTLKRFFQTNKRSVGQRVRRESWWDRNKSWIVPVGTAALGAFGRDVSSAAKSAAVPDNEIPLTGEDIENVNEAIDFLENIVNTASDASQGQ